MKNPLWGILGKGCSGSPMVALWNETKHARDSAFQRWMRTSFSAEAQSSELQSLGPRLRPSPSEAVV